MTEQERLNGITGNIIGAAIQVHRALGPGLLESAYEACLAFELGKRGLRVEQQKPVPLIYDEVRLDCGYRVDLLVEGCVVLEIKSVGALAPIHEAQVMSYLKLSGCKAALLINFNVRVLRDGIRRFVNGKIWGPKAFTTENTESTEEER
jgi:GxxExxY protein